MVFKIKQSNITDYFNTISASKSRNLFQKSKIHNINDEKLCDNNYDETTTNEDFSKTTPKRRNSTSSSTTNSKKRKTISMAVKKSVATDNNLVRRGRCPIDFGPMGAIRKLDFDDCIQNDNNNNSFVDFLKSREINNEEKSESKKKLDSVPLMNAEDIKERLKSCKNLNKLKEQLANINGCSEKIRKFKEMKIKPQPKSPLKSPMKSPRKLFGYSSPHHLIGSPIKIVNSSPLKLSQIKPRNLFGSSPLAPSKKTEDSTELLLPLPNKFKYMLTLFKLIDYNSWRMYKRQEVCTFDKLKQVIEDSTHRTFTLDMLLQILTINKDLPKFRLSWELYAGQLKLVITPIYDQHVVQCLNSLGILLKREKEFQNFLLEITRMEHLKFLSQMNLTLNADDKIYRWHPMFKLDLVPDIKPDFTLLPNKPEQTSFKSKKNTILDYFDKKKPIEIESSPKKENSLDTTKIKSGLLKGISTDLLNKVRAKEAAKLAQQMKRPPEKDREIRTLSKLIDVSRIIYDCFVGSNIRSIEMENLVQRISDSMPMSINESRRHLEYLCSFELDEVGTKWIQMIPLKNNNYIKIDSMYPLANLYAAFRKRLKQLQEA